MTDYNKLSESLVKQLEAHGVAFDNDREIYEVKDFVEGRDKGASYHDYLTAQLQQVKADKEAEITKLQEDFYSKSIHSMDQQQEASKPVFNISKEDVLELAPTEAMKLRNKIGTEAYRSIMDGDKKPIQQLLEDEPDDRSVSFEQYRGANLQDIAPSLATLINRYSPEVYQSLIK